MRILSVHSLPQQLSWLLLAAVLQLAWLAPAVSAQQRDAPKSYQISLVEFMGLRRLTQEQALALSGLQSGDPFSEPLIDTAAKKLMDSGMFARLGYAVKSTGNQVHVTFQVEEANLALPVVFDNFVWFTDAELFTAIRRDVEFFNGTVPESGAVADAVAAALQRLLDEKKIPGRIEHLPEEDLTHRMSYLFSVRGVPLPVCTLHFPGSSGIPEDELRKAAKQLTEREYSKTSTATFATISLFPLYRHIGRLRAKFNEPTAVLETADAPACKGGIALTITVEEGLVYSWDKAEWTGNQALSNAQLDEALSMKAGEVADGLKIDKGLKAVAKALGRKGYIAARISSAPSFDDKNQRVAFKLDITEGPQYKMGELVLKGFSEGDAKTLRERWSLKAGDVFDATYAEEFLKTDGREVVQRIFEERRSPPRIRSDIKANRQALTVDVSLELAK